ncbi:MAG: hypothetical protein ACO3N7_06715 [Kiritimatiellia bacterium]
MNLFIIDGISPFFKGVQPGKRVNWSKIPFQLLEKDGVADLKDLEQICEDFDHFCSRAAGMGYNTVTLDDLAHMLPHPDFEPEVNRKLEVYAAYYARWISIAASHGMKVLITTDFMFTTPASAKKIGKGFQAHLLWFRGHLLEFFKRYPQVAGIVLRIGESDGQDVVGDFRSKLMIRKASEARRMLASLLPEFERNDRLLIFRLWSVGAYPIGDLIWNRNTLHKVFGIFQSRHLVLSIKHGESDFFRYLPLNKQFFRSPHQKIVELQARREYEGCGEYPSYIGNDVQEIRTQLQEIPGLIGMSVWCQTGGWTRFQRLTFMENSSVWNEINTWVCIKIFREGLSSRAALISYAETFLRPEQAEPLIEMMNASDQAVKKLLYIDEIAQRKLYFRRVRLPSTISVYWDRILILHPIRKLLKCLVDSGEAKVIQGENALAVVHGMRVLARKHGLPDLGLDFMYDSFRILAEARRYYFLEIDPEQLRRLQSLIDAYTEKYPVRYSVRLELTPFTLSSKALRIYLKALLREKRGYRAFDHVFTLRFLSLFFPVLRRMGRGAIPDFMHKQAMGLEAVFK